MRYKGFESIDNEGQKELRLVFPDGLDRHFFARMYCRGELMDRAGGGPELIWRSLSSNFNNIKLVAPHQVHGTHVIPADSSFALPLRPEADGVMIVPGSDSLASLRFADCCPVVIASDSPVPWMLMLHSGFAGTAKNIVRSALSSISGWYGEAMGKRTYGWTCETRFFRATGSQYREPLARGDQSRRRGAESHRSKHKYKEPPELRRRRLFVFNQLNVWKYCL